jgi:CDP-diglyceride synthetase
MWAIEIPTRTWSDFVVSSHLAFLPSIFIGMFRELYEAVVLISIMTTLSVLYHREEEKNHRVAAIELCSTTLLFVYGVFQMLHCPQIFLFSIDIFWLEGLCAVVTIATYLCCFSINKNKRLYDLYHPIGLHLFPSFWALLVALYHHSTVFWKK